MEQRKVDISYRIARLKSEILCAQTLLTQLLESSSEIAATLNKEADLTVFRGNYPAVIADLDNWLHHVVQFNCVVESQMDRLKPLKLTKNTPVSSTSPLSPDAGEKELIQASSDSTLEPSLDDQTRSEASQARNKLLHRSIDQPLPVLGTSTEIAEYSSQRGSEETQTHNNLPSTLNFPPAVPESTESSSNEDYARPGSVDTPVQNLTSILNPPPAVEDFLSERSYSNDNSEPSSDKIQDQNSLQPSTFDPPLVIAGQCHPPQVLQDTDVISSHKDLFSEEESKSTIIIEDSTEDSRSNVSSVILCAQESDGCYSTGESRSDVSSAILCASKSVNSAIHGEKINGSVNILSSGEPLDSDRPLLDIKYFSDALPQISGTDDPPMVSQEPKQTISGILENQAKAVMSHTNIVTSVIKPFRTPRPRMQNQNKMSTNLNNPKPGIFGIKSQACYPPGWNNNRFPSPNAIPFHPPVNCPSKPGPIHNGGARPNYASKRSPGLGAIPIEPIVPSLIPKFPDDLLTLLAGSNDWFGLVAHAINPSEFYFHVSSADNDKIDQFHKTMNNFYHRSTTVPYVRKWEVRENVGDFCAIYFHDNSTTVPSHGWYRGQVVDWLPDSKDLVLMQLVDYGNKFTAELADVQPLQKRFAERAVFATRCHLSYLKPPQPCKEWPRTASAIFQKHLKIETMEKSYMISPTGKEVTPPFCRLPNPNLNHDKSVPVILIPDDNSGSVNDYLLDIDFAEFDEQMEVCQVEAMENSHRENLRMKEMEESRRKVEEWCIEEKVVEKPKRPAREPSPDFWLSAHKMPSKARPPPPDEIDEWDPMKEDYENAEMNDEDPCVAVTGYAPTDESRICRHFADSGHCPWGMKCRREHVLSNIHGITTDKEEVFCSAFNELPMRINGEHLFIKVTSAQCGYFYAIEQSSSALDMLCAAINARANVAAYKRLKVPPALGQIVLAKSSEDNRFYRARIIDGGDGSLNAFVFFVDFGNWELVPETDLREIEPRFMHLAFQAIRCSIFNVEIFKEMYSKAAQFLTTEYGLDAVLEVVVVSGDGTTIHVLATDKDHNDIGELLIRNGFGTEVDYTTASYCKLKPGNVLPG